MRTLRLAAYGNSLYLRGIAACLAADAAFNVVIVDPAAPDSQPRLNELAPDAIVCELDTASLAMPLALSLERPGLLLVVMDRTSEEVLVLSGQRAQPATASELVDVLVSMVPAPSSKP